MSKRHKCFPEEEIRIVNKPIKNASTITGSERNRNLKYHFKLTILTNPKIFINQVIKVFRPAFVVLSTSKR